MELLSEIQPRRDFLLTQILLVKKHYDWFNVTVTNLYSIMTHMHSSKAAISAIFLKSSPLDSGRTVSPVAGDRCCFLSAERRMLDGILPSNDVEATDSVSGLWLYSLKLRQQLGSFPFPSQICFNQKTRNSNCNLYLLRGFLCTNRMRYGRARWVDTLKTVENKVYL